LSEAQVAEPLVVVEEAFRARGAGIVLAPRFVAKGLGRGPFDVRLRLPDASERIVSATLDLAHISGPNGAFAMIRLHGIEPEAVPPGTEVFLAG